MSSSVPPKFCSIASFFLHRETTSSSNLNHWQPIIAYHIMHGNSSQTNHNYQTQSHRQLSIKPASVTIDHQNLQHKFSMLAVCVTNQIYYRSQPTVMIDKPQSLTQKCYTHAEYNKQLSSTVKSKQYRWLSSQTKLYMTTV